MSRFVLCFTTSAALLALPSFAAAQDCDPEQNPACFCSDSDGFPCDPSESEDCFCEDFGAGGGEGDEISAACESFFVCLESSCAEDDLACAQGCADEVGGEEGAAIDALISCVNSSGCSIEDEACLEASCSAEAQAFTLACIGDDSGFGDNNGTVEPGGSSVCDDFFFCADECFDLSCVQGCASSNLSGDASVSFNAAISCIQESGCSEDDEDCLFNSCGGSLDAFSAACFGEGATAGGGSSGGGSTSEGSSGGTIGGGDNSGGSSGGGGGGLSGLFGGDNRSSDDGSGSGGGGGSSSGCAVAGHGSTGSGGLLVLLLGFVGLAARRRRR